MKGKIRMRHVRKLTRTKMPLIRCSLVSSRPSCKCNVTANVKGWMSSMIASSRELKERACKMLCKFHEITSIQQNDQVTWMRIFPKEMNGVLNSVVNRQPMKKSPNPLLKNWGVRLLNRSAYVKPNNRMWEHNFRPRLPKWWAGKRLVATNDGRPASTPSLEISSGYQENDGYRCWGDLCPSEYGSSSHTWRRCQRPYMELQTIQTHWSTSDCKKQPKPQHF